MKIGFGGFNIGPTGGPNKSVPQAGAQSVSNGGLKQDTVQFSTAAQLGTEAALPVFNYSGGSLKLDPKSLSPNTLTTLQQAAKDSSFKFPPISETP